MKLFDLGVRTDTRLKGHSESEFAYLNQSARPSVLALHTLLEGWFQHFPSVSQADLRSRFRSPNDNQHAGALFELYVHELLRKLGYEITVHPELSGVSTHPDFLVRHSDGCQFLLEATLAGIPGKAEQGAGARLAEVYDVLNRMDSPDFFLHVKVTGTPSSPPPAAKLRTDVEKWLRTLDVEAVSMAGQAGEFDTIPKFGWAHAGWEVVLTPIAKSPASRGKPGIRPLGAIVPEAQWLHTDLDLKDALEAKARKYGTVQLPLMVAVNVLGSHCDEYDILNGLFGQEGITVSLSDDGSVVSEHASRKRNGFWIGPKGARNQAVSAVLIVAGLNEWNMGSLIPETFHNPWASYPLNPNYWPLLQNIPNITNNRYDKRAGKLAREVIGIPNPWPLSWD